ncbi:hypothetical protein ACYE2N_05015 [Flavobacterium sp. MAHUQ-51]|uniref:hypothetical protein n=1 Tax=Flavobacterium sp. GCM10022190 TaxID=3252639 RepID=UPI0036134E86
MKYKYLLEIFDILIIEIQNHKKFSNEQIITQLQNVVPQSYLIYQIDFVKTTDKIQYKIRKAIHNLHPNAPALKKVQSAPAKELLKWLPKIEKQLELQDKNKNYIWNNDNPILYIVVNCKLEELPKENLFFLYYNWLLKTEAELVKRRIKEIISKLNTKIQIQDFIHKKQSNIECFLNKLLQKINPESVSDIYEFSTNDIEIDCIKLTYIYIEKLMCHIEKDYYKYLDRNSPVPIKAIIKTKTKIEDQYNSIKTLSTDLQFNKKLMMLIEENLSKIIELKIPQSITYHELFYSVEFITRLLDFANNKKVLASTTELEECLIMLNFNTLDFFNYYTDQINTALEEQETDIEKIKLLYKYLKSTNQKILYTQRKLIKILPTTKEQIIGWIEEEIYYLNQKRILEPYPISRPENQEINDKILTGLSVPQLSYFFSLLIQTGILQPKTQRAIFRFISNHFKTKITDRISVDSLNSKYYNVETATKYAVREKIIDLLNCTKL